jgi:predicted XRE-type DNA-binding protein
MNETIPIEQSSGNVFADLDYPNAEEALNKARLAQRISEIVQQKRLTQVQAAQLLQIDQPKVSKLLRGRLREFSTDRLLRFLTALDQDVDIVIRRERGLRRQARINVIAA